ncbi:MAG: DUF86 domain-containing protein [Thermoplasmata archaeon]|nr:DUF86 domain-containing protein [Thermoplasmata archaeon]
MVSARTSAPGSRKRWCGVDRNKAFLKHIRDEIAFLRKQCQGLKFEELIEDDVLQRAVSRSLEIIGEAVKNLSLDFKEKHPEVEWRRIAGLRDKLIHQYFGVDWLIVWDVLTNKLPELENKIRALIEKE